MFIAHAPAAYLIHRIRAKEPLSFAALCACGLGAIFPDVDLLYFYFLGARTHSHHSYFTHFPIVWAGLWLCFAGLTYRKTSKSITLVHFFLSCVMLHFVLDSVAGNIRWLWPLSLDGLNLVQVPNRGHSHWVLNFIFHWTFAVELLITLIALALAFRDRTYYIERLKALAITIRKNSRAPSGQSD